MKMTHMMAVALVLACLMSISTVSGTAFPQIKYLEPPRLMPTLEDDGASRAIVDIFSVGNLSYCSPGMSPFCQMRVLSGVQEVMVDS